MSTYTQTGYQSSFTKPKVSITDSAYNKIMYWVDKAPGEISGLGHVEKRGDTFYITDAFLLPQKNASSSTDIEPDDVAKAMFDRRNVPGEIQFWWHSHVNMGVFWSGTDTDTMQKICEGGYFISTVFNKKRETKTAFCIGQPILAIVDDVPLLRESLMTDEIEKALSVEYDANVKVYTHTLPSYRGYSGDDVVYENGKWVQKKTEGENGKDVAARNGASPVDIAATRQWGHQYRLKEILKLMKEVPGIDWDEASMVIDEELSQIALATADQTADEGQGDLISIAEAYDREMAERGMA